MESAKLHLEGIRNSWGPRSFVRILLGTALCATLAGALFWLFVGHGSLYRFFVVPACGFGLVATHLILRRLVPVTPLDVEVWYSDPEITYRASRSSEPETFSNTGLELVGLTTDTVQVRDAQGKTHELPIYVNLASDAPSMDELPGDIPRGARLKLHYCYETVELAWVPRFQGGSVVRRSRETAIPWP